MFARLWWKEWRGFWPIWLTVSVVALLLQWMFISLNDQDIKAGALTPLNLVWALLYAFAVGAAAFAGERESNNLGFLDALPVPRDRLWLGKSSFALASTVALALLMAGMASLGTQKRDDSLFGYARLGGEFATLLFLALAWGLFWSSVLRNPLAAGALSVVSVGFMLIFSAMLTLDERMPTDRLYISGLIPVETLPILWGTGLLMWVVSGLVMTGGPKRLIRKRWAVVRAPRPPAEVAPPETSAARSLLWQTWREGARTWALIMVVGVVIPVLFGLGSPSPGNDKFSALILTGLACLAAGVSVFGPDNAADTRRFLRHHGVLPGTIWNMKLLLWGVGFALFLGLLILVVGSTPLGPRSPADVGIPSPWVLAGTLLDAFAVALVCGMAIRRRITAGLVSLIGLVAIAPVQVGLAGVGMIPEWSLLISPLILIFVSRAWAGEWLADRDGPRPWVRLGLLVAVPFATLAAGYVAYRAWSLPDIGPIAVTNRTPAPAFYADRDAERLYRQAVADLKPVDRIKPDDTRLSQMIANVVERGWNPWDDSARPVMTFWEVNKQAIAGARQIAPIEAVRLPGVESLLRPAADSTLKEIVRLADLLALDARECQHRGDLAGMWADILAQFQMVRQVTSSSKQAGSYLAACNLHQRAVGLAVAWAGEPKQTLDAIRKAKGDLATIPPFAFFGDVVSHEARILDATLSLPADDLARWINEPIDGGGRASILSNLATRYLMLPPWERERARRIGRQVFRDQIADVDREPYQRSPGFALLYQSPDIQGCPLARMLIPATESYVNRVDLQVAARRGLDQMLALIDWKMTHDGEYPQSLQQLVPGELPSLPLDPYTGQPFRLGRVEEPGMVGSLMYVGQPESVVYVQTRHGQHVLFIVGSDRLESRSVVKVGVRGVSTPLGPIVIPLP